MVTAEIRSAAVPEIEVTTCAPDAAGEPQVMPAPEGRITNTSGADVRLGVLSELKLK